MNPTMLIVFAVVLIGMTYFQMRAQKKQAQQQPITTGRDGAD